MGARVKLKDMPASIQAKYREEKKRSKFKNVATVVDGIRFASRKEAKRWGELSLLLKQGKISQLEMQEPFPLVVNGVLVCKYLADFTYEQDGVRTIEDVKSAFTRKNPVYRLKKKLMSAFGHIITEV